MFLLVYARLQAQQNILCTDECPTLSTCEQTRSEAFGALIAKVQPLLEAQRIVHNTALE